MTLENAGMSENHSEYYNRIITHYGEFLPEQKLDILRCEMQCHIDILRRVIDSMLEVDSSVWQILCDGCGELVIQLPEKVDEIEYIVEKNINNDISPLDIIEGLCHYIPAGPFGLVLGLSGAISKKAKEKVVPGLPGECEVWAYVMGETILKMRFLTYALLGRPL